MNTEIAIQEKDLELIVSEKRLGSLTTNARQIKAMIEQALPHYDIANYNEDNIESAKKDKAMLNNSAKLLNAKRLEIEKEWMKPFGEFKDVVSETVKLISECSAKIDTVVKQSEEKAKQEKREGINRYWESKRFSLVSIDKVFDAGWLNKGKKPKSIHAEIDAKIEKINDDIATLEAVGEDVELLKSLYLDTLNINSTIQYANTLKQNRERAKAAEDAKKQPEITFPEVESGNIPYPENPETHETPENPETAAPVQTPTVQPKIGLLTRVFKVTATRENIIALGNFMNERGIDFEKIEL
ncbi:MAG: DUF1351 domain-containing protein [Dysgonamonadaceae bacterium]|jgi:hypothetical protein|nr:DUF1351 domain-containing protein [Dysgonamonadaceae bacterium]